MKSLILKNVFQFTLTNGIILLSTLLTAFIIPSFFSLENYGYYKLFTLFISFYGIFHFGFIDGIYLKYAGLNYPELNKDLFRRFTFFLFISQTFMALLLMIVTLTIFQNGQILFYIFISIDLVLTNLIFYFQYVSQMTKKFSVNITASSIQAALNLILVSFLFIFKQDNYLFFISFILVINIITIIYYLISFKEISFFKVSISQLLDIEIILHIKEIIKIGIPFLLSNLFTVLIFNFSRLFISFIYNIEKFALFSFSFTIITFLQYVLSSVSSVIFPYLKNLNFDLLKSNYSKIVSIIQFLSSYLLLLFFPISFLVNLLLPKLFDSIALLAALFPSLILISLIQFVKINYYKVSLEFKQYIFTAIITFIFGSFLHFIVFIVSDDIINQAYTSIIVYLFMHIISEILLSKKFKQTFIKNLMHVFIIITLFYLNSFQTNFVFSTLLYFLQISLVNFIFYRKNISSMFKSLGLLFKV
jgi:O-antigen/teichoic acid export membrane protein